MASTNRDEISRLELLHAAHPDGLVFPHLADAYRRAGRYSQAESVLNAGLRRHEDYSSAHVVLGRLRLDQGKRREAENAFQRVLQLDPHNHIALEYLGRMTAEEGRAEEALDYLRRLASIKPSDELAEQITGLERQAREARDASQRALASGGGGRETAAQVEAGSVPRRQNGGDGDPGTPRPAAPGQRSQADVPAPPEPGEVVTETMAELYARQGLHERAEAVYRQLSERDPGNARLQQKLTDAVTRRRGEASQPPAAETAPSGPSGPSIQSYLTDVLAWAPDRPEPADTVDENAAGEEAAPEDGAEIREPWASAPVSGAKPVERRDTPEPRDPADEPWAAGPASDPEPWATTPVSQPAPTRPPEPAAPEPAAPEPSALEPSALEPSALEPVASEPVAPEPMEAEPVEAAPVAAGPGEDSPVAPPRRWPGPTPAELGLAEDDLEGADARTRALIALTDMLVGLLEYRDPFFRGSSSLTRLLATNVADEMGLDASDRINLALAAVLRDLGRLALGGRLVDTQKGTKTQEARRKIERHVDLALHLMEGIELPRSVTLAVRHHHERWDGAGYPDGLAGEEIPQLARVLAVVDSFAAMVSPRPYRLPRKVPDAARELQESAGTQYDPQVVEALVRMVGRRDQPHLGFVQRHHILLVNPDQPGAVVTAAKLCTNGYLAEVAVDPDAARERLRRVPVAALVVSAEAGADAAEEFIRDLRLDPLFASLPIVAVDAESVGLRVRLLESGADVCFPPGISYGELQGTLGALVRRTLRSRETRPDSGDDEAPWLALQGDVQDFPLAWLLQVMKYDSRTAGIGIRTTTDQGAIYIENGDAVHAQIRGGANGEEALKAMLQWGKGRFTVQPDARSKERSIESSIMNLLLTQAVEEDHAAAGIFGAVSEQG